VGQEEAYVKLTGDGWSDLLVNIALGRKKKSALLRNTLPANFEVSEKENSEKNSLLTESSSSNNNNNNSDENQSLKIDPSVSNDDVIVRHGEELKIELDPKQEEIKQNTQEEKKE
jgi:hypothetical protein